MTPRASCVSIALAPLGGEADELPFPRNRRFDTEAGGQE